MCTQKKKLKKSLKMLSKSLNNNMKTGADIITLSILKVNFDDNIFHTFHLTNNVPSSFPVSYDMLKLLE